MDQRSVGYAYRSREGDVERTLKTVETGVRSQTDKVRKLKSICRVCGHNVVWFSIQAYI